jgi:VWFA-related protein
MSRSTLLGLSVLAFVGLPHATEDIRVPPETDVRVTLVLLDTVVTDRKGSPIRGLQPGEFQLLVDNEIVPIEAVEEFCGVRQVAGVAGPSGEPDGTTDGRDGAAVLGNGAAGSSRGSGDGISPAQGRGNHYILFFDMSHLKVAARRKAVDIAREFVSTRMGEEDRAMILAFSRGLYLVSGFTGDREFLGGRLEQMDEDRALLDTGPFEQEVALERLAHEVDTAYKDIGRGVRGVRSTGARPSSVTECEGEARIAEFETTRALRAIANAMPAFSGLPGRKALMLFTETLQADPSRAWYQACAVPVRDRPSLGLTVAPEIRDLAHRANLAGVSFYPMHAGGMSAEHTGVVMDESLDFQKSISLSTGGEAFVVMRNPLAAFDQAARDLSCYYMLAYRVGEDAKPGRHTVAVRVSRKKVRVRHRESFILTTAEEASEREMLAVLSNPGLYSDLPVSAKGYSLGDAGGGRSHYLIQASVPLEALVLLRESASGGTGRVHLRGGVISEGKLACQFSGTHEFGGGGDRGPQGAEAGVQAICDLAGGEYELVIAGRDEVGGALGTFWGRFPVQMDGTSSTSGALLWAPAPGGSWSRAGDAAWLPMASGSGEPLFVRHTRTLARNEPGVLTFTACRSGGRPSDATAALSSATLTLRGTAAVTLAATAVRRDPGGRCELLQAEINPSSLPSGSYDVVPGVAEPWKATGSASRLEIR